MPKKDCWRTSNLERVKNKNSELKKNSPKNLTYQKWTWLRIGPGLLGNHPIWKMFGWVPYNPVYVQLSEGHWKMYLWLQRWHHFGYLFRKFQPFFGVFVVGTSPCSLPHLSGRKKLLSRGAGRGLSKVTSSGIWRCSGSTSPKIATDDISGLENPPNFHECLWDKHEAFSIGGGYLRLKKNFTLKMKFAKLTLHSPAPYNLWCGENCYCRNSQVIS